MAAVAWLLSAWMWLQPVLIDGKCSACLYEGQRSTVHEGVCSITLVHCPPYYDEDGKYIVPDCNRSICNHWCSRGHRIVVRFR